MYMHSLATVVPSQSYCLSTLTLLSASGTYVVSLILFVFIHLYMYVCMYTPSASGTQSVCIPRHHLVPVIPSQSVYPDTIWYPVSLYTQTPSGASGTQSVCVPRHHLVPVVPSQSVYPDTIWCQWYPCSEYCMYVLSVHPDTPWCQWCRRSCSTASIFRPRTSWASIPLSGRR